MTRLTFDESNDFWPLWTPDGKRIVFTSTSGTAFSICWKAADGSGAVEKLASWPNIPAPFEWSKDGKTLLSWDLVLAPLSSNIATMPMEGKRVRKPLLEGKFNYDHPRISPDGRWLVYSTDESGQNEVYVCPFPEVNKGRWQVSTKGGYGPLWSPDGREIFYRNGEAVMAVSVETEPVFNPGKPKELFQGAYFGGRVAEILLPNWDISPDGKRFLMMKPPVSAGATAAAAGSRQKIIVVLNWFEELKQRVPVK